MCYLISIKMKIYSCIIGIICVLAIVKCADIPPEVTKMFDECAKDVGLSPDILKGVLNFEDSKVKCLHACILEKSTAMVDGKIVVEKLLEWNAKYFPEGNTDSLKTVINECTSQANEEKDRCDVAGIFHQCFFEKHPQPKK